MTDAQSRGLAVGKWLGKMHRFFRATPAPAPAPPAVGLALGGGFARGIAHVGVLRAFEKYAIPIRHIAGVSAGAMVAAAYASGATCDEITKVGSAMRFADVARWSISKMGLVNSERMDHFLRKLLKSFRFEDMKIPLGVVATDLLTGDSVEFRDKGDVAMAIRASCSYPGLFQPIQYDGRMLVDGAMSIEIPAPMVRAMGSDFVVSVHLPMQHVDSPGPSNLFQVINRCFQIMQTRMETDWRRESDVVITPDVSGMEWDCFGSCEKLAQAGEIAALEAIPKIKAWLDVAAKTARPPKSQIPAGSSAPSVANRLLK